ncbi:HEAT repeat domain-containing protein [Singulisphaera sp. Ch08]|uniref:HEAT repeat domain-containing protein n=1 Tax=Singulisphaera sp. Ch08 TaxID=3120278 RepID=A0AAU7CD79_9BACT
MFRRARHSFPGCLGLIMVLVLLTPIEAVEDSSQADRRVTEALALWEGGDTRARHEALHRLKRLGPRAAPAVPVLISGLAAREPRIRKESAQVLSRIGPAASRAVHALVAALNDPDGDVRTEAARALMTTKPDSRVVLPALVASLHAGPDRGFPMARYVFGSLGEVAVPVLIDLLKQDNAKVRRAAVAGLSEIGPGAKAAVPFLVEELRVPDRNSREAVVHALAGIGPEAVEPLARALRDRDPRVRGGASLALEMLGEKANASIPALIAALSDPEPPDDLKPPRSKPGFADWSREGEPRPSGYYAALRATGPAAVPALLARLDDPDRQNQVRALRALGFAGHTAKTAVPRLIALLSDPELRLDAVSALGGIGQEARAAIPTLVTGLKDPDADFRARTAESLGRIGWERQAGQYSSRTVARGAVAPLAAALKDPAPKVRAAAARALADIGDEAAIALPELVAQLRDPVADVRLAVLRAFPRLRQSHRPAVETVLGLLNDVDSRVRTATAALIDDDDLGNDVVIARLIAALRDPDAGTRAEAAYKLARTNGREGIALEKNRVFYGYGTSEALARSPTAGGALRTALADPDPRVRTAVAYALPVLKREAIHSIPLLSARLKDPDRYVRIAAAVALGKFGPDASSAVPALLDALNDDDGTHVNDFSVSSKAAKALRAIGPDSSARLIDRLFDLLGKPDERVRARAGAALQEIGSELNPRLVRTLTDPKTPRLIKVEVLRVLAEEHGLGPMDFKEPNPLGPELREAILTLRALLHDDEDEVRSAARRLLALDDVTGETAARFLLDTAREEDPDEWEFFDQAAEALESPVVGVLVEGLKDPDDEVRTVAAHALASLAEKLPDGDDEPAGENATPEEVEVHQQDLRRRSQAVDALVAALKDSDTQVRWAAAWALYVLGSDRAIPALIEMAKDKTTRVRTGARIRITPVLGGGNGNRCESSANGEFVRVGAIQALGGFGALAAPAVPALTDALRDDDPLTRWFAAAVLAEIGPMAKGAVPELIALLRSKDELPPAPSPVGFRMMRGKHDRLAVMAAEALGKIGPDARAAVVSLTEALVDPDEVLRCVAAEALGGIGADAEAAVPSLIRALHDPQCLVGDKAAMALGQVGVAAVPALIEVLHGHDPDARRRAMTALGGIGPKAAPALTDLVRAVADPDEEIRTVAAEALGEIGIGPEAVAAIPGLIAAGKDPDRIVRKNATEALGKIRPRDDRVIPALITTLRDRDSDVRAASGDALTLIGEPAFPGLWDLLRDDDDEDARDRAAWTLSRIANPVYKHDDHETDEQAAIRVKVPREALLAGLKDPDERVRAGASRALGYMGKEIVPALVVALGDSSRLIRLHATRAFGFIGSEARSALGPLRERLGDTDSEVRRAAEAAINAILKSDP